VLSGLLQEILELSGEHLVLVFIAIAIATAIGIPTGILLTRRLAPRRWVLGFASVMQTVPSLALFGFLIPIPLIGGIGKRTAIVALVLYALLPILRNTLAGILGVDPAVRESAVAMGMTPGQLLRDVARCAHHHGRTARRDRHHHRHRHHRGRHRRRRPGRVHFSRCGVGGQHTDPRRRSSRSPHRAAHRRRPRMDRAKTLACLIAALLLTASCSRSHQLTVASKNFTEQVILGEIIAQHLEHRLGGPVSRKLNLGGTLLTHQALVAGQIDLYPEYTGTALTAILKQPPSSDPAAVLDRVRQEYRTRWHIDWLDPLGFNNTFAMAIRGDDARRLKLETLSDAARAQAWTLGAGYEFQQRPDGLTGLLKTYSLRLSGAPKIMDLGLLYKAIEQKQVDMISANSTDGPLSVLDLKVLADDKHYFPPYEAAVLVREDSLSRYPGLREALTELSGKFTDVAMQKLNHELDGKHRPAAEVAKAFLRDAGLTR